MFSTALTDLHQYVTFTPEVSHTVKNVNKITLGTFFKESTKNFRMMG